MSHNTKLAFGQLQNACMVRELTAAMSYMAGFSWLVGVVYFLSHHVAWLRPMAMDYQSMCIPVFEAIGIVCMIDYCRCVRIYRKGVPADTTYVRPYIKESVKTVENEIRKYKGSLLANTFLPITILVFIRHLRRKQRIARGAVIRAATRVAAV
jgi:hypothetical protein